MGTCCSILKKTKSKIRRNNIYQEDVSIKNMITQKVNTAAVDPTFFDTKQEFHNDETSGYWLPKDEEEQKRLTAVQTYIVVYEHIC